MSENITHTAIVDDCLRLMVAGSTICDPFKAAALAHHDMAQLGCMTRSGDRCNPGLLTAFRDSWSDRAPGDDLEPKLAFVLGWLCHRAADREMKPIFRRFHPDKHESPTACSITQDAFIFREVYAQGAVPPYHPAMFGAAFDTLKESVNVAGMTDLLHVLLRRSLIEMHTLIPDVSNPEQWIDRLYKLKQVFEVDLARYDKAIVSPDPEDVRTYIIEDNFYDRADAIVDVARRLQRGEAVLTGEVDQAVSAEPGSHYAKALKIGMGYLQAASDYFTGDIEMSALRERLDIGKPGEDGLPV